MSKTSENTQYYERFQVEDVLSFFSGRLVLAKSRSGTQVFLQDIAIDRPLPPGSKEMLLQLRHPHLAPILDVMEEKNRVVLVHPPLVGDPLPLVVTKEQPMSPLQAVRVFERLLKTKRDLNRLPLPIDTTLDPRNVCMVEEQPMLLFYGINRFGETGKDEKWRSLLYFLLTGHQWHPEMNAAETGEALRKVPQPVRQLALDCLEGTSSMSDAIKRSRQLLLQAKMKKSFRFRRRYWYRALTAATVVVGGLLGMLAVGSKINPSHVLQQWMEREPVASSDHTGTQVGVASATQSRQPNVGTRVSTIPLTGGSESVYRWPQPVQGPTHLSGELQQKANQPLTIALTQEGQGPMFGVQVDGEGRINLVMTKSGKSYTLSRSDEEFRVLPNRTYLWHFYYMPEEPLRFAIGEKGKSARWLAAGVVPPESVYALTFRGGQATKLNNVETATGSAASSAAGEWMQGHPWDLVYGKGVLEPKRLHLNSTAQVKLGRSGTFSFLRPSGNLGDPLQLEMDNADGHRFRFVLTRTDRMVLYRLDEEIKKVADRPLGWKWQPDQETSVAVSGDSNVLNIRVKQSGNEGTIGYTHSVPVSLEELDLINHEAIDLLVLP
ncbi:hypothetical protein JQC72_10230 [Polycladomyces sp. WAk]|uniref:Uncharacterized protein n=1 Tax=Polycladomyces zharkentensis TaxID=2807616 RepID=A0ABS2WK38_9BACL|nr:hypothetical protein [Polycladomyces sp. WAk]MBN2909901.1 hypothetical protein [Polycladomyces sp. WAk]